MMFLEELNTGQWYNQFDELEIVHPEVSEKINRHLNEHRLRALKNRLERIKMSGFADMEM